MIVGFLSWGEALIILGAVVVLFGASRLPGLARSVRGLRRDVKEGWEEKS